MGGEVTCLLPDLVSIGYTITTPLSVGQTEKRTLRDQKAFPKNNKKCFNIILL